MLQKGTKKVHFQMKMHCLLSDVCQPMLKLISIGIFYFKVFHLGTENRPLYHVSGSSYFDILFIKF